MIVVLDASAGIGAATGSVVFHAALAGAARVTAPALYDFEVTNTVWKYRRFGSWTDEQCATVLARSLALVDDRAAGDGLAAEALALARKHGRPAYDMFYVALALRHDAVLATSDAKLRRLAVRLGARITNG